MRRDKAAGGERAGMFRWRLTAGGEHAMEASASRRDSESARRMVPQREWNASGRRGGMSRCEGRKGGEYLKEGSWVRRDDKRASNRQLSCGSGLEMESGRVYGRMCRNDGN